MATVSITPIKPKHTQDELADTLEVNTSYDNLIDNLIASWVLKKSDENIVLDSGNIAVSGQEYATWDSSAAMLMQYIANQLGVETIGDIS